MNYQEALDYIHGTYKFGSKLGLENVSHLLKLMGNPHQQLKYIHVAGTNGKGSTSSYLNSILLAAGYKVGLYTSPFLEVFTERIRVNNENIPESNMAEVTAFVKEKVDEMLAAEMQHPTEFEITTAIAFEHYRREKVDVVVLEVGMGGRLDSTNVIDTPLASVITPIDMDHVEYLGDTLAKVAAEKGGIIKKNGLCIMHPQEPEAEAVLMKLCSDLNCTPFIAPISEIRILKSDMEGTTFGVGGEIYDITLLGEHQTRNATVALTTALTLREEGLLQISDEAIHKGLKSAKWAGRMEMLSLNPMVMIDGAHNLHGAKGLSNSLKKLFEGKRIVGVMGILADKDVDGVIEEMMPFIDTIVCTAPDNPRKLSAKKLAEKMARYTDKIVVAESIDVSVKEAFTLAGPDDLILYFGSLYMIGEARTALRKHLGLN